MREGQVQTEVAAAFTHHLPKELAAARAAGAHEPPGRTSVTVPAVYAATPRVLITRWLDAAPLSALLDGHTDLLPEGWRELGRRDAADRAARLLGHAIYAPAACTGWMHADLHPGNFLLLPGGRLGMLDFGAAAATPGGIPAPFGQLAAAVLAAAVLAGDGPTAIRLARQAGALAPDAEVDPRLIIELLHPLAATGADTSFTYSRAWLRGLMAHLTQPHFAPALRNLTPPPEYALVWRATLSAAGLFAQLGATVFTRGFHLAYSPGFRGSISPAQPQLVAVGDNDCTFPVSAVTACLLRGLTPGSSVDLCSCEAVSSARRLPQPRAGPGADSVRLRRPRVAGTRAARALGPVQASPRSSGSRGPGRRRLVHRGCRRAPVHPEPGRRAQAVCQGPGWLLHRARA